MGGHPPTPAGPPPTAGHHHWNQIAPLKSFRANTVSNASEDSGKGSNKGCLINAVVPIDPSVVSRGKPNIVGAGHPGRLEATRSNGPPGWAAHPRPNRTLGGLNKGVPPLKAPPAHPSGAALTLTHPNPNRTGGLNSGTPSRYGEGSFFKGAPPTFEPGRPGGRGESSRLGPNGAPVLNEGAPMVGGPGGTNRTDRPRTKRSSQIGAATHGLDGSGYSGRRSSPSG